MRDHSDTHIDRGPDQTSYCDQYNPMPWELPTSTDNFDGSARTQTMPRDPTKTWAGSPSDQARRFQADGPITQTEYRTPEPECAPTPSQRSSTRSRVISLVGNTSMALGLAILLGLFVGPRTVMRRAEEAAFASWRALGNALANRELGEISEQLDRDREDAELLRSMRDSLWARLQSLAIQRERVVVELKTRGPRLACDSDCELPRLDAAIALVNSAIARADRAAGRDQRKSRGREVELITLQAEADINRANLAFARPIGDPALWSSRVARMRDLLGSPLENGW